MRRADIDGEEPGDPSRAVLTDLDERFRAPLQSYFFKRVRNRAEADDLTQEVFVRLVRRPGQHPDGAIHAYIFAIAANLMRDRGRMAVTRQTSRHQSLDEMENYQLSCSAMVEEVTPERVLLARETLNDVVRTLALLSERTRDIFILARLERMQHREIAALHGITVSAVEKHVANALAHLGARFLAE